MSERPTPETDAVWRYPASFDSNEKVVQISLAQKLERERDEAREALREIRAADWKTSGELRGMARKALEAAK